MKPMIYSAVVALLVLSSCSTAYRTAQTPDDVYYSPVRENVYANNTARNTDDYVEETYDEDEGNYVTYADEDEERYDYARRIDRFSRGYSGNYWDGYYFDAFGPSMYMNNYWGSGLGWGSFWGPSVSIGFGWGYNPWRNPWGWNSWYGGGWGHPWYGGGWGNPWYGSGWYGNYYPGWGGGWHGGGWAGGYYNPRPSNSWGPRSSSNSRVFNSGNYAPRPNTSGNAPIRTFDRSGTNNVVTPGNNNRTTPRRVFQTAPSERPVTQPNRQTTRPARTFDRSNSSPAPNNRQSAPAPQRQASPAPSRSFPSAAPAPSNNRSSSPSSTPARTTRPRGG
ncbi:hypothetical protein [Chitinophaga sp. XS-30]|uniref:hypothetical protein n=1 Tax=Chitinophaga sp. XS-30 TaxID=2604421 RepID=UPI0011DC7CD9|nr:hypothetical protein [Chitinophaga sp. XS-30]QEH43158.1 hypothetical protein FW415_20715 [Chitinophaga sp. XS-30]